MDRSIIPLLIAGGAITLYFISKSGNGILSDIVNLIPYSEKGISPTNGSASKSTSGWYLNNEGLDLLDESQKTLVEKVWTKAQPYMKLIVGYGTEFDVHVPLILSVILAESAFNPNAKRFEPAINQTSVGLMQILPTTAKQMGFYGTEKDLTNPTNNLRYGIKYIAYQLNRYNRNLNKTVAAYNAGSALYNAKGNFVNQTYVNNVTRNYSILNTALAKR
jgi:soluble lytic murein transglycosylase-like protein